MKKRAMFFTTTGFMLLMGLILLWIPWLGETPFYSKGEPREAIVAMSMLETGEWILPSTCGGEIPFKPPFFAWLIAIFAWLFNGSVVNEFVSRLPSSLAAVGMIMMGYKWAKSAKDTNFALTMALVTATSFEVFRAAEACRVDMVLTAAMVGAIYIIYEIRERKGRDNVGWYAAAAALLTIATLTKGPIGSLLPCLAGGIYLLLRGDNFWKSFFKMFSLVLVSFVLPALWYYAAWKRGGDMFLDLAWEENIGRLTGSMSYESHVRPFWYNFVTIIAGMLPWTLLGVLALFRYRTYRHWPFRHAGLLSISAALTIIIFYCIPSSKRSVYLLPAYPFMAYGITVLIESLRHTSVTRFYGKIMAFIGIAAPVAVALVELVPNNFFPGFHLHGWLSWLMLCLPVAVSIMWLRGRSTSEVAMPVIWALLVCYSSAVMPAIFHNPLKTQQTAEIFQALQATKRPIYIVGTPNKSGLAYWPNFYLGDRMRFVKSYEATDSLPAGCTLWIPNAADTAKISNDWAKGKFGFNPDTRRPAWIATKMK